MSTQKTDLHHVPLFWTDNYKLVFIHQVGKFGSKNKKTLSIITLRSKTVKHNHHKHNFYFYLICFICRISSPFKNRQKRRILNGNKLKVETHLICGNIFVKREYSNKQNINYSIKFSKHKKLCSYTLGWGKHTLHLHAYM